jgi:hypothetical protein
MGGGLGRNDVRFGPNTDFTTGKLDVWFRRYSGIGRSLGDARSMLLASIIASQEFAD